MDIKKLFVLLFITHVAIIGKNPNNADRQRRIISLEKKITQLEAKICSLESGNSANTYTKISLRSLKRNFLKSSFALAVLLELFDKAEKILQELAKIEPNSNIQLLRKKLKIAKQKQKTASQ